MIAEYQAEMGWVDRHNRHRQQMLGLHDTWNTKRWQTRTQLEIFGIALVDSFLLARKFMPKWRGQPDTEGVFWKFVRVLIPQLNSTGGSSHADTAGHRGCQQTLIGKAQVKTGAKQGTMHAKQGRCSYCVANGRKEKKSDGTSSERSPRAAHACVAHPHEYICRIGKGPCWEEHLAAVAETDSEQGNDDDDDDAISNSWR